MAGLRMDWPPELDLEFARARQARLQGNEGRARVCARRAAGIAARLYLERRDLKIGSASALDLLNRVAGDPSVDPEILRLISVLTLPVDTDFKLPDGVDLIADAEALTKRLLE